MRLFYLVMGAFGLGLVAMSQANGECVSYVKGPVIYDINSCRNVSVPGDFDLQDENFRMVKGLDRVNKAQLYDTYKGVLLNGQIVKSKAIQTGLEFKGALKGQKISIFVPAAAGNCAALKAKRVTAEINEMCCDGAAEAPCMLDTSYYFKSLKVLGNSGSSAGNRKRKQVEKSSDFRGAIDLYKKKKYKKAADAFESMRRRNNLDVRGHYLLAVSYHKQEQCKKAIAPLEYIYRQAAKDKVWADQNKVTRGATFLLARCYARVNNAGKASIILNSYLIEPKKYRNELKRSLQAYEFGFIHTSKDYREFKRQAIKYVPENDNEEY